MFETFDTNVLLAFVTVLIALVWIKNAVFMNRNLPPGPRGLPIVGYLPFLTKKPHLKFQELGKTYGNIFSLQLGSQVVVVLNDAQVIKEAFGQPGLSGRPSQPAFVMANVKSPFFNCVEQPIWIEHRRFALHALRDLGLGKSKMHDHVQDEIEHLIQCIQKENGKPVDVKHLLTPSMSNNISALVFGKRYNYDHPERIFLDQFIEEAAKNLGQTSTFVFFPWLMHPIFKKLMDMDNVLMVFKKFRSFARSKIQDHKDTVDSNHMRDFIDSYLIEKKHRNEKNQETTFSDDYLVGSVQNLFGAGSETVRTTVEWCLYTLAAYPEVQSKVFKELDEAVGNQRSPNFVDQKLMPYTQAFLQEVQRWKTAVPINFLRATLDDINVSGYTIPKNTIVMANFWAAHHDPKCWEKPEEFIPERFLSLDRKTALKNENYMPFSYGKRACPGEGLAVLETFLYVTSILQKFSMELPDGKSANFEGNLTLTYHLKPQTMRFISRK